MSLRDRPDWFNKASEPILELLHDSTYPLNRSTVLSVLHLELEDAPSRGSVYSAFGPLVDHGLLVEIEGERNTTLYSITERGRAYLAGELDADELE